MKLLMISGDRALAEGKHGAFYNTLEEFHKHWERIDIICPKATKQEVKEIFGNVFVHPSPWPLIFQPIWIFRQGLFLIRNTKYQIQNTIMTVHEFPPFYNGIGARLLWSRLTSRQSGISQSRILDSQSESGQKIKVPYILEIFHVPGFPKASNLKESFYRLLVQLFVRFDVKRAKAVRVMNNTVGEFLINSGVPKEKIKLIPAIYVDLEIFKPMALQKEYDLIFIGRMELNKGIELLLKAIEFSIFNFQFSMKCLIVGDGPERDKIKKLISDYNLPVTLFGYAKDSKEIAELINRSKLLVMTSYNEGGPRVVVEAMACGVPVLATPVGIVPDLLKNNQGGEIIAWDEEDIAKKARALLNDSERYNKLSNEAVEIAKQFEKKSAIKNYADKLQSLI